MKSISFKHFLCIHKALVGRIELPVYDAPQKPAGVQAAEALHETNE